MGAKVLIVDGDPAFAGRLQTGLARLGCSVTLLDDGGAAVAQATGDRPDLILAAIELPGTSGFALCDQLRGDPNLMIVPVVLMAEGTREELLVLHQDSPTRAEEYLRKPIALQELVERIGRFLSVDVPLDLIEEEAAPAPVAPVVASVVPRRAPTMRPARHVASAELHESAAPPAVEPARARASKVAPAPTPSMVPPGMSAREYLDVRELLSAKERELHKLEDALRVAEERARDIEERFNGLQRANLELVERLAARDVAVAEAQTGSSLLEKARADKELAQKRADDFAKRLERTKQTIEPLRQELAAEKELRVSEAAARQAFVDENVARLRAELMADHDRVFASIGERYEALLADEREQRREELTALAVAKDDARLAAIADTDRAVREELAPRIAQLETKLEAEQAALVRAAEQHKQTADLHERALADAVAERERVVREEADVTMAALRAGAAREVSAIERATDDQVAAALKERDRGIARVEEDKARALAELRLELGKASDEAANVRDLRHREELVEANAAAERARHVQRVELEQVREAALLELMKSHEAARQKANAERAQERKALEGEIAKGQEALAALGAELEAERQNRGGADREASERLAALNAEISARQAAIQRLAGELGDARLQIAAETARANRAEERLSRDKVTLDEARKALEEAMARVDSARQR
jgi:CheY-like chemotaxis protein